jgi:hypothetical protein
MQYSPKLKKAAEEIKAILEKHDIAGIVHLHTPGHAEYITKLNPSYSCVKFQSNGDVRIQSRLQEDHNGNREERNQFQSDTSNMLSLLSDSTGNMALSIMDMSRKMDEIIGAEHGDTSHTSHTTQNN